ncbi:hypothetical protein KP509_15G071300 [Ceratopteris richardii]|uniref:Uncharacterized protein n=1 Tax=Ceratopteris richardii TaxID=49495 RepID=A0A8T2T602_CERRI|nr:hypothetical protein KP509_15G071300 [Ceratopteris richardii]
MLYLLSILCTSFLSSNQDALPSQHTLTSFLSSNQDALPSQRTLYFIPLLRPGCSTFSAYSVLHSSPPTRMLYLLSILCTSFLSSNQDALPSQHTLYFIPLLQPECSTFSAYSVLLSSPPTKWRDQLFSLYDPTRLAMVYSLLYPAVCICTICAIFMAADV